MKYLSPILVFSILLCLASFTVVNNSSTNNISTALQKTTPQPVVGLNLGNLAPDIMLADPNGKKITLSSLRGKVVLIDFWASWCGPCRHENPSLVKAYLRYKDKKFKIGNGFTVYGVSLDANGEAWKKAIEKDGLSWESHVSDLQGWNSGPAAAYGVTAIPANFLLNDKGIIINKNLRGVELQEALEKLVIN